MIRRRAIARVAKGCRGSEMVGSGGGGRMGVLGLEDGTGSAVLGRGFVWGEPCDIAIVSHSEE
jgi:hypothetical protein